VDTGVGIDHDKLDAIFQTFYKLMENRELNLQGCGLGLIFSKQLSKALGGDITVTSDRDRGTKFTVKLRINND
jgi:two-component system phosphate regulon sensor histidine kinase PhoR